MIAGLLSSKPRRLLAAGTAFACLAFAVWLWFHAYPVERVVPARSYQLQPGELGEWTAFGGSWEITQDVIHNYGEDFDMRGAKLVTGSPTWGNYTLTSDIRFDRDGGDMGIIFRSNDEAEGLDSYNGYYVGLRMEGGDLIIGRSNYGWIEARPVTMPGGVHPSVWYRLRVTAYACNIAASAENLDTHQTAWIAFQERFCLKTGRIGLRSVNAGGRWRNISIAPAGWNDYLHLRQHAASVEQPVVLPGPPWWTPWHAGTLFGGILAFALLAQLIYFRMERWKTFAITQERQRLAHEIHDTMAQSFAGIGYQLQGIRSGLLRGGRQDSDYLAEQLGIAYQLVRRCHTEASETIAMLGSPSVDTEQNLLKKLAATADKLAGSQIKTVTKLQGSVAPLNLRTADALLHIGEEAIANAVIHANPTLLMITLNYEDSTVELVVRDDGAGFEYSPSTAGFGILGMQKRARDVVGTFEIRSTVEHGTQVCVKARLQQTSLWERILSKVKVVFLRIPK